MTRAGDDENTLLVRDALFYCKAVAQVVVDALEPEAERSLLLQDWQGAATALALSGRVMKKVFLVL